MERFCKVIATASIWIGMVVYFAILQSWGFLGGVGAALAIVVGLVLTWLVYSFLEAFTSALAILIGWIVAIILACLFHSWGILSQGGSAALFIAAAVVSLFFAINNQD